MKIVRMQVTKGNWRICFSVAPTEPMKTSLQQGLSRNFSTGIQSQNFTMQQWDLQAYTERCREKNDPESQKL